VVAVGSPVVDHFPRQPVVENAQSSPHEEEYERSCWLERLDAGLEWWRKESLSFLDMLWMLQNRQENWSCEEWIENADSEAMVLFQR